MKQTYTPKIFDRIVITITLIFTVYSILKLFNDVDFISSYLIRMVFATVSTMALFSMLYRPMNGERFSRIFFVVGLIFPAIIIGNKFLTDFVFYGAYRPDLLQKPLLFVRLICGIVLLFFSLKLSNQSKSDHIKDYGMIAIGIGTFLLCYSLTTVLEPMFNTEQFNYPFWKIITKSILAILTVLVGFRIKNQKTKFGKGLLFVLLLMFVFGLI